MLRVVAQVSADAMRVMSHVVEHLMPDFKREAFALSAGPFLVRDDARQAVSEIECQC